MQRIVLNIVLTTLGIVAMLFAYSSGFDGVYDGECSGLDGYAPHCYSRVLVYFLIIYLVIPVVVMKWCQVGWFYLGSLFSVLATYLYFFIGNAEHMFFNGEPYMPTLWSVWFGVYLFFIFSGILYRVSKFHGRTFT